MIWWCDEGLLWEIELRLLLFTIFSVVLGVTMEEVVDAQMEILAQYMEACQALFILEEKQNY